MNEEAWEVPDGPDESPSPLPDPPDDGEGEDEDHIDFDISKIFPDIEVHPEDGPPVIFIDVPEREKVPA